MSPGLERGATTDGRPLRIVFFLLHPGFVRFFGPPVEELLRRGHEVELAFSVDEKDPGDARLATELAERHERLAVGPAPGRDRSDGWRSFAAAARILADVARYADPRFARAPKLRARAAETAALRLGGAGAPLARLVGHRAIGPVAEWALRRVERAIPTSAAIDDWLRARAPDAVLVSPLVDFGSSQTEFLKSAAALGVPSALCVASWDNLTSKGLIRGEPDRVLVWNDEQVHEATALHHVERGRVVVTGAPKFDEWFDRAPATTVAEFAAKAGVSGPFVLYLCSSPFIAPDEVSFVQDWLRAIRGSDDERLAKTPVVVRPHPQNAAQWSDIDLSSFGDAVVWPRGGAQPDAGEDRSDFFDSLAHATAVVGVNTSGLVEAAIVGRDVFTILDPRFADTQEGTLHYQYLRRSRGGFLHEAHSLDEHLTQLASPGDRAAARAFVRAFVRPLGLERSATGVFADAVEALAATAKGPETPSVGARLARAALRPVAAALGTRD